MKAQLKVPVPMPHATRLKVTKGPYKGVVYKLVASKITIGRSSENDIALNKDDKCSRKQALLQLEKSGHYSIKDLSKRASLKINNIVKIQSDLQDGDLIQFGSTVMQMEQAGTPPSTPQPSPVFPPTPVHSPAGPQAPAPVPSAGPVGSLAPAPLSPSTAPSADKAEPSLSLLQDPMPPTDPLPFPDPMSQPLPNQKAQKPVKKKIKPKIILVVVAGAMAYLLLSDNSTKEEEEDKLRTQMEREESVKTLTELKETEIKKREKNQLSSYKHAQFAYIRGIRDYRKGVYSRAVESFRACKTLYPQHDLCGSYLEKARTRNQQLIQAWMIAGKRNREKRRFVPCMSSFQNVMTAIRDKKNLTYKEAFENYTICKLQHEDRY